MQLIVLRIALFSHWHVGLVIGSWLNAECCPWLFVRYGNREGICRGSVMMAGVALASGARMTAY